MRQIRLLEAAWFRQSGGNAGKIGAILQPGKREITANLTLFTSC